MCVCRRDGWRAWERSQSHPGRATLWRRALEPHWYCSTSGDHHFGPCWHPELSKQLFKEFIVRPIITFIFLNSVRYINFTDNSHFK